jgi:nitrite reductase (NO-forming)
MKTTKKHRKPEGFTKKYLSPLAKSSVYLGILLMTIIITSSNSINACESCNRKLSEELTNERAGSLFSGELLAAIENQKLSIEKSVPASPKNQVDESKTAPSISRGSLFPNNFDFIDIVNRDKKLSIPGTGLVPQGTKPDKQVRVELNEGEVYAGNGVMYKGFTMNGTIPGPHFDFEEGDIVEITFDNKGNLPHGASIHAAYTQTSKYLGKIEPGTSKTFTFQVNYPGVYMYHCAPGGHAIPMHIIFGQYGTMVVKPKKKYKLEQMLGRKPDVEITLGQHEFYASGKDAVEGQGKPMYTAFNGKLFRYVEEPIKAKPGDYVRINYLNFGPNLVSTFHLVGIIWDYAYWQGHPDNVFVGGQSVTSGPTDSWVLEFRMPADEGAYLMLSHAVGSTDRGAIGILMCDRNAQTPVKIMADGPKYSESEMAEFKSKSKRTISPFEPGTLDVDPFHSLAPHEKEVTVKIIGNSFFPKRLKIAPGTKVTWINEDVFTYLEGEFSGIHNAVAIGNPPERFASPLLGHAESFSHTFEKEGDYEYICTPHPYMKGLITVEKTNIPLTASLGSLSTIIIGLVGLVMLVFFYINKKK